MKMRLSDCYSAVATSIITIGLNIKLHVINSLLMFSKLYINLFSFHKIHYKPLSEASTMFKLLVLTAILFASLATPIVIGHTNTEPNYEQLADAIFKAEGGSKSSTPYGIRFKGCSWADPTYSSQICINTLKNTYKRHSLAKSSLSYLEFLRDRYAPLSDHPSNINWLPNTRYFYER